MRDFNDFLLFCYREMPRRLPARNHNLRLCASTVAPPINALFQTRHCTLHTSTQPPNQPLSSESLPEMKKAMALLRKSGGSKVRRDFFISP
jgi:hypothetical protein